MGAPQATAIVIDPVCKMPLDPATATAGMIHDGQQVYFCSAACHRRFAANPRAYMPAATILSADDAQAPGSAGHRSSGHHAVPGPAQQAIAAGTGILSAMVLLGFYFGVLALVSGWEFTLLQFSEFWPYIVALALGFGTQVGLFTYLRRAVHAGSGRVVAATGTTSGAAMIACCTHYLVNLLPALGATGLMTFVGQYQIELFWFALAANLVGILYIGRRVVAFTREA